jgi:hypothetical protein
VLVARVGWIREQGLARIRMVYMRRGAVCMPVMGVTMMLVDRSARNRYLIWAGFRMRRMLKQVHALVHGSQQDQEHQCKRRHAA